MNYIHSCSCDNSAPTESHQFVRSCTRNVAARTKLKEVVCKEDAPDGTHLRKGHAIQPTFSCLCFKFGQVILLHTMSSPQFLFQAHKYRLQAHLYQGSVLSEARCESMWIRAIPHRSGSIDSARAVDGSTYYEYVAGIVHISTQLGNSTRLTFHEGKRRRPRRRTLPRRAIDAATRSHRLKYRLGHDATPPCGPCCARAH